MRTQPAFRSSLGLVAVSLLGACAAPGYESSTPRAPGAGAGAVPGTAAPQREDDYSVSTLFHDQHGDVLQKARGYRPNARITYWAQPNQAIKGESGQFDETGVRADIFHDLPIDPNSWLTFGFHGRTRNLEFTSGFQGAYGDERLWETGLILGGGTFVQDDVFVELQFEPGLYTDFDDTIKSEDWQFFGHVHATWRQDDNFFLKGGVRTDRTFHDIDLYPQFGLVYQFDEQWRIDTLLPNYFEIQWNPTAELLLDVGIELEGQEYSISESGATEATWKTQDLRLYAGGTIRIDDTFSVLGRIGGTVGGNHRFDSTTGGRSDGTPQGSMFVEFGLGLDW